MADPHVSPISQLLQSMGMTREDLHKRSNEMRQFLTANDPMAQRVTELTSQGYRSRSSSDLRPNTRSSSSSFSMARSQSRASTHSRRDMSPPATPVKTEYDSGPSLHRPMDNMEMIIERQRQSRKERKSKRGRERVAASKSFVAPSSPSPSNTSQPAVSLDSFMYSRDEPVQAAEGSSSGNASSSEEASAPPPVTPQKSKYYREHTMDSTNSQSRKDTACKVETPTPTRILSQQSLHPPPPFYAYPLHMAAFPHYLTIPQEHNPVTPQKQHHLQHGNTPTPTQKSIAKMPSPLPPSSPFLAQSSPPPSSPCAPRVVHAVSSPGPMGELPTEDQYDKLPYKLPPGPYSATKPDLSYAALVGQAIISSAEHRLTLQEIYDWITIVYPHYKRGETTWMNSIRHVLSTTACFRKVPRDRSIGRTLWAIFDEDLECFKGGGFRKHLCKDIMSQQKEKAKKTNARKRPEGDDSSNETRKAKKARKDSYATGSGRPGVAQMSAPVSVMGPQPTFRASHPYFPRPTQHQPYYESCMSQSQPQVLPAEIIFPPLPPDAALRGPRIIRPPPPARSTSPPPPSPPASIAPSSSQASTQASSEHSSSSMPSVPELTPNRSSSTTPPSSVPATSDMDVELIDDHMNGSLKEARGAGSGVVIAGVDEVDEVVAVGTSLMRDDADVFESSMLGPVQSWGSSPGGSLGPGIELIINSDYAGSDDEDDYVIEHDNKGKGKASTRRNPLYPSVPASPTPSRANAGGAPLSLKRVPSAERPKTPTSSSNAAASSSALPSTPPQRVQLSSTRTPISHKGLTMSPTASLAHYKSNLDPPPVLFQLGVNRTLSSLAYDEPDHMRTPRKGSSSAGAGSSIMLGPPVTPKRGGLFDSPFPRSGMSPFRTPGRGKDIFDPHDPALLLHEELNRPVLGDSPVGIFGKRSLLYDSPGPDPWGTPGKKWFW
ncbi:forkhead box protein I1 [Ephemerocybe angulata]|uniref:Forkhead box protein I1 n=1 Tax=Ephemerocybe angulata TaxID=980116 RepID=A0A8H6ID76_9AGAR|nr:forkhead box protein I1 [Tulosesus angulatus]